MTVFRAIVIIVLALLVGPLISTTSIAQQIQLRDGRRSSSDAAQPPKLPNRNDDSARAMPSVAVQRNLVVQPSANPLSKMTLSSLSATRERPIFSPSRRPPASSAPLPLAQNRFNGANRPPLTLLGVIAGGEPGIAVFLDGNSQAVIRMKVGEIRSGWMLHSVKRREATLIKDQQQVVLAIPNVSNN